MGDKTITGFEAVLSQTVKEKEGKIYLKTRYVNKVDVKNNPMVEDNFKNAVNASVKEMKEEQTRQYDEKSINKNSRYNERRKERANANYDEYERMLNTLPTKDLLKILSDKVNSEVYRLFDNSPIYDLKAKKSYFTGVKLNDENEIVIDFSTLKRIYITITSSIFSGIAFVVIMYLISIFTAPKRDEYIIIKK